MEVDPESGLVKQVFEDGAAERAGVQAGWIFQTVSGKPYELLTLKALLRGEEPFEATFGVLRPNPVAVLDTSLGVIEAEIFLDRNFRGWGAHDRKLGGVVGWGGGGGADRCRIVLNHADIWADYDASCESQAKKKALPYWTCSLWRRTGCQGRPRTSSTLLSRDSTTACISIV